jgi:hypothetical protein
MAVSANPGGGFPYWVAWAVGTDLWIDHFTSGGTFTNALHLSSMTSVRNPEIAIIGNRIVVAVGSSSSGEVQIDSADVSAPTVWSPFLTGSAVSNGWLLKSNGSVVIAMAYGDNASANPFYWYSNDGITWHARSMTFLLNGSDTIQALCWSPYFELFFAITHIASTGNTGVLSSPDGIGWSVVANSTTSFYGQNSMAAIGHTLYCSLIDNGSGGPSGAIFSPNGGHDWYLSQESLADSQSSSLGYLRPHMTQGDFGLAHIDNNWGRFSLQYGLPLSHL